MDKQVIEIVRVFEKDEERRQDFLAWLVQYGRYDPAKSGKFGWVKRQCRWWRGHRARQKRYRPELVYVADLSRNPVTNPEPYWIRRVDAEKVLRALPRDQQLLARSVLKGYTLAEFARERGISRQAAHAMYNRLLARLERELGP